MHIQSLRICNADTPSAIYAGRVQKSEKCVKVCEKRRRLRKRLRFLTLQKCQKLTFESHPVMTSYSSYSAREGAPVNGNLARIAKLPFMFNVFSAPT